jgi:hypothetical protein
VGAMMTQTPPSLDPPPSTPVGEGLAPRSPQVPAIVTVVGAVIAGVGIARTSPGDIGGLGLLNALDPAYLVGVAVVIIGATLEAFSPGRRNAWFVGHVVVLVLLLHGATGLIETYARFPSAYLHVGFADQIAERGSLLRELDARFNWPSFFSGGALVQQATGGAPLFWALRFFPVLVTLVVAVLVDALGRATHVSLHRRRAAVLLFVLADWIGQDYFSPQATALVLALTAIVLTLTNFGAGGLRDPWARWVGAAPQRLRYEPSDWRRAGVLAVLCLLAAAMVTGHQITSGFLALSTLGLAVTGSSRLRAFPFLVVVATIGWVSFAAEPYWSGHLQTLTGSAGRVQVLVQQNVSARAAHGTHDRALVVDSRLAFTALLVLALLVSCLVMRRRGQLSVPLACLAICPWPMLLLQAYGGEMALRVLLVTLPTIALLAASAFLPERRRVRGAHQVALAVILIALLPLFLVARYGNESYEQIASSDLRVLDRLYADQPGKTLVMTADSKGPRFSSRVGDVRFVTLHGRRPVDIVHETADRPGYPSRYVWFGPTMDAYGVQLEGERPGWTIRLADQLVGTGRFVVADRNHGSVLLRFVPAAGKTSP